MADKKKVEEARRIFGSLDINGDGTLSGDELAQIVPKDSIDQVMKQLDPKGKGVVSFEEFLKGFEALADTEDEGDDNSDQERLTPKLGGAKVNMTVVTSKINERSASFIKCITPGEKEMGEQTVSARVTREQKFKRILHHLENNNFALALEEVNSTILHVCQRNFTSEEKKTVQDIFMKEGIVTIDPKALASIIKETNQDERKKSENSEWDNERFISTFLDNLEKGLHHKVGAKDTSANDIKQLEQENRQLKDKILRLTSEVNKHKQNASKLDDENQELRIKVGQGNKGNKTVEQQLKEKADQLKSYQDMVDQLQEDKLRLQGSLRNIQLEHQTKIALLKVRKKMLVNSTEELKKVKIVMNGLLKTHGEQNKLELKKKVGKMTAIITRRRLIRELQVDNDRIPQLEVENVRLKEVVAKLQEEAKEYLRLMDTYNKQTPSISGGMVISSENAPSSNVKLGIMFGDDEELEQLRKKLKSALEENGKLTRELDDTKNLLEEEKQARVEAEEKCKELTEKCDTLTNQITALEAKSAKLESDLEAERAGRKRDAEEYEAKIAQLEEHLKKLQKQLDEEIEARKALEKQLADMGDDSQTKISELVKEIAELKRRVKELESELHAEKIRREKLEEDLERVKGELEMETQKRKELEEELEKTQAELEEALKKIQELEAKLLLQESEVVTIVEAKVFVEAKKTEVKDHYLELNADQQAELSAYTRCFNNNLGGDSDLEYCMPLHEGSSDMLFKLKDGLLISKFINKCVPHTIDERALNLPQDGILDSDSMMENLTMAIGSAKAIGIPISDDRALEEQLLNPTDPDLILEFLFGLIKTKYFQCISVRQRPELIEICDNPETGLSGLKLKEIDVDVLKGLDRDSLLMRWINWHRIAEAAGKLDSLSKDWGEDLSDSTAYSAILSRIAECKHDASAMEDKSKTDGKRARHVIDKATYLKVDHFHIPNNITSGSKRLNLLFAACLFNCNTGFSDDDDDMEEGKTKKVGADPNAIPFESLSDELREERAYRMWINSCGIPNCFVNNLFLDSRDGLKILKLIDYIRPDTVNWKKAEKNPKGRFQKLTNCGLVIKYAKRPLKLKLKFIEGTDIAEGNQKLIMALMGQLMRYDTMLKLEKAFKAIGIPKGTNEEKAILDWANDTVAKKQHQLNDTPKLKSFTDKRLSSSLFLFNLIWNIQPKLIKWKMVNANPQTLQDKTRNAGYVISVSRKLGAEVYLLPHDIVDVKKNQVMLFFGSIMAVAHS